MFSKWVVLFTADLQQVRNIGTNESLSKMKFILSEFYNKNNNKNKNNSIIYYNAYFSRKPNLHFAKPGCYTTISENRLKRFSQQGPVQSKDSPHAIFNRSSGNGTGFSWHFCFTVFVIILPVLHILVHSSAANNTQSGY
jgi:hypothetical protein